MTASAYLIAGLVWTPAHLRVGVTGGRDFADAALLDSTLTLLLPVALSGSMLVHGGASGADRMAAGWWSARYGSWCVEEHAAHWRDPCISTCAPNHRRPQRGGTCCPAAGVYRNQEMVDSRLNLLVALPGGRGTADMVQRCRFAQVPVLMAADGGRML